MRLYDLLHRLDGDSGLIRQCEFFLYTEKDRAALEAVQDRGYRFPEVTSWIRAVASDFQLVKAAGVKETGILTSCSDYHIFHKLNLTRAEALRFYLEVVDAALEAGITPRCHFEDLTRADVYGFALPFAQALMERARQSRRADQDPPLRHHGRGPPLARGRPARGACPSWCGPSSTRPACRPPSWSGTATTTSSRSTPTPSPPGSTAAARSTPPCSPPASAPATPPSKAAVIEYLSLAGGDDRVDTRVLTEIATYMRDAVGVPIPAGYPLLGSEFNVTRAGIHADGLLKDEEIYNVFDTDRLLGRPVGVSVNDKSGDAGVAFWVNQALGRKGDGRLDEAPPGDRGDARGRDAPVRRRAGLGDDPGRADGPGAGSTCPSCSRPAAANRRSGRIRRAANLRGSREGVPWAARSPRKAGRRREALSLDALPDRRCTHR